jgi:hypothetical protein
LRQVTNPCRLQPAYQTSGSFPPPVSHIEAATPAHDGPPQMSRIAFPTCRAPYPSGSRRVPLWMASPLTRPSPSLRRVGIRNFTFETGPGFPHVTVRWMAQLPKAALSRGSDPTGCPAEPLVRDQINRPLSGWILPPRMTRPVWAHGEFPAQLFHPMLPNRVSQAAVPAGHRRNL